MCSFARLEPTSTVLKQCRWTGCSKHAQRRAPGVTAVAIPPKTLLAAPMRASTRARPRPCPTNSGRDKTPLLGGGVQPLCEWCFEAPGFSACHQYATAGLIFSALRSLIQLLDSPTRVQCAAFAGVGCTACRGRCRDCRGVLTTPHRRKKPGAVAGL